jgi:hypothetical protein
MPEVSPNKFLVPVHLFAWMLGFIAIVLIGGSMSLDLTGMSSADQYVVARWGFPGLRIYLWLEGALLSAIVAAVGAHVISAGLTVSRGEQSRMFGIAYRLHRMPRQYGYIFVVLGACLVALSLTTLALLNSCRYMRLI